MTQIFKTAAVLFDMDGILLDSEPLWKEAERELFKTVGINIDTMHIPVDAYGLRIDEIIAAYHHFYPWNNKSVTAIKKEIISLLIKKVSEVKPILPGVISALDLCRSMGLKIGLASSSTMSVINAVTELFNITHYFDIRYSAEHLKYGKPHPEVYLLAAKALQVDPVNCITIEDSVNGMIATKAARMKSIVVPLISKEDPRWSLADIKLASLLDLTKQHLS